MMKESVKLREKKISGGPQLLLEYNFYFSKLINLKTLMKKFQQTQLNVTTSIIPGHP